MTNALRFQGATFDEWILELEYTPRQQSGVCDPALSSALRELSPSRALFTWLIEQATTATDLLRLAIYADGTNEDLQDLIELAMRRSLENGHVDEEGWTVEEWLDMVESLQTFAADRKEILAKMAQPH